jgi:hypothetical protein
LDDDGTRFDDVGAVLILALIFVIVVSLSVLGLITFGGTGLLNATNLQGQRSLEFAADGATSAAVQAVRYSYNQFSPSSIEDCLPDGAVLTPSSTGSQTMFINGLYMTVDCAQAPPPLPPNVTRSINFYACVQQGAVAQVPPNCLANNAVVVATVNFDDVSTSGLYACASATVSSTCGTGMTIGNWIVETANN